jgi:hypothetical protein
MRLRRGEVGQTETEAPKGSPLGSSVSGPRNRPPPDDDSDKVPPRAFDAELDLAAEMTSALDLLSATFGEANDWAGAVSVDSDVEMAAADAGMPRTPSDLLEPTDFEAVPTAHKALTSRREEKKSAADTRQTEATPAPRNSGPAQL